MTDFAGTDRQVISEVSTGAHEHRLEVVSYLFPDGSRHQYVETRHAGGSWSRHHVSDVVHALQKGDAIYQVSAD